MEDRWTHTNWRVVDHGAELLEFILQVLNPDGLVAELLAHFFHLVIDGRHLLHTLMIFVLELLVNGVGA